MREQEEIRKEHESLIVPMSSKNDGLYQEVATDVHCMTIKIANICLIGDPSKAGQWILIDTGMPQSEEEIIQILEENYGDVYPPQAIILTHGHFDHVGAVSQLVDRWNIPVYIHELEMPYVTGQQSYPEPDNSVEGGMVAGLSNLFPNEPIQIEGQVLPLPQDQSIPGLTGWKWIATPGHSPGHISLFRETDKVLISGDAVITVKQDSFYKVLKQEPEVQGPPRYFTTDWEAAKRSASTLFALKPEIIVPGHGQPMFGPNLHLGLQFLVENFNDLAVPDFGKYLH